MIRLVEFCGLLIMLSKGQIGRTTEIKLSDCLVSPDKSLHIAKIL
jgi:hypothetical protein